MLVLLLLLLVLLDFIHWHGCCHCKSSHEHQGQKEGSAPENRQRSSLEVAAAVAAAAVASSATNAAGAAAAVVAAGGAAAVVTANVPMHNPRSKVCARSCHNGADNVGPTTL